MSDATIIIAKHGELSLGVHIVVFWWVVMSYSGVVGYQRFGVSYSLCLHMEAVRSKRP